MLNNRYKNVLTALLLIAALIMASACSGSTKKTVSKENNKENSKENSKESDAEDKEDKKDNRENNKEAGKEAKDEKEDNKNPGDVSGDIEITTEMLLYTEALDDAEGSQGDKYELTSVKRGDFDHTVFAIGEVEYRDIYYQTLEIDSAEVVEWKAEEGDFVKKGDIILTYKPIFDEAAYEERVADIKQQEKEYIAGYDMRRAEIIKNEHELSDIKNKNEREIKRLEIKKLKLALKEYKEMKVDIDNAKKEIKEFKSDVESGEVTANHDGYILSCADLEKEQLISKGEMIATVSPKKDYLIKIDEFPECQLRYNSDVTIKYKSDDGEESISGRVVMSTNILSNVNSQEYAYVECNEKNIVNAPKGNVRVYFRNKALKDVLLVDASAVKFETKGEGTDTSDVPYVYIYENGTAFKRYIEVFGSNSKEYLVLSGLSEGQQVVLQQTGSKTAPGGN